MSAPEQTIHLELYAPNVKSAIARAQTIADERKHPQVTPEHVAHSVLEGGWVKDVLARTVLHLPMLRTRLKTTLENTPPTGNGLSYLSSRTLTLLGRTEAIARERSRDVVDFQCLFVALGEQDVVPRAIGAATWSPQELTGVTVAAPAASPQASTVSAFDLALSKTASAALGELGEEMAKALGYYEDRPPREVTRTISRIKHLLSPPNDVPNLDVEREDAKLVIKRSDGGDLSIVVEWAKPDGIDLVLVKGNQRLPTRFTLNAATQVWTSSEGDLFRALRAAIIGLYPSIEGKVKP